MDTNALQDWLIQELAKRLEIDARQIDVHERFSRYGLDSARALGLVNELAKTLERALLPTLVWDHPTIDRLTRYLLEGEEEGEGLALASLARVNDEPVAIVGLSCRFPKASDPAAYWQLLCEGIDAIEEVPEDRWPLDSLFDPDSRKPGKMSTRWGGFLDHIDTFDAQFFDISPREAEQVDPQQRLMLELAWEALEDASIPPLSLRGSRTGVFAGVMWSDYAKLTRSRLEGITEHTATGQDTSIVSARVSYSFGLEGPSLSIDTACSSSLVAVYMACQSLRHGDADLALAGGVHLVASPYSTVSMTKFGAMAPDGRSKAFDHRANGYVRGEGGGLVILKPLSRAIIDGDRIYAVIRGGAINNDGFSNGLTAPNPKAQESMLRIAYDRQAIDRTAVHYVETHGTGTMLGDPIEAGALGRVLGQGRKAEDALRIGSVKTNFGHTEAAAGIAGLIKVILAMRHRQLPPSLHFERPNPHIPFDRLGIRVQTELGPWPEPESKALAGVSSFGFGGTNCHLVVEETTAPKAEILALAAATWNELTETVGEIRAWAETATSLNDICCAARSMFEEGPHRLAVAAGSKRDLMAGLDAFLAGDDRPGVAHGIVTEVARGAVFVASGQGAEWVGMARELLLEEPVFNRMMRRADELFRPIGGWSLLEELLAEEPRLTVTEVNQPIVLAVQVSLAALWRSWGIEPAALVGHSAGEIAVAVISGALDLERGLEVTHHRGRLTQQVSGTGRLAVLPLPSREAEKLIRGYEDRLSLGVVNSPEASVISGNEAALEEVLEPLRASGIEIHYVKLGYASHSPEVEPVLAELGDALAHLIPARPTCRTVSTVTADWVEENAFGAEYWRQNLRQTVRFADAVKVIIDSGFDTFIEISSHPVLVRPIREGLDHYGKEGVALPSLRRGGNERLSMLESLAVLWTRGHQVRWQEVLGRSSEASSEIPVRLLQMAARQREARASDVAEGESLTTAWSTSQLYVLSARSEAALVAAARDHADAIRSADSGRREVLQDLSYTSTVRRTHLEHRLAVVADSVKGLSDSLKSFADGKSKAVTASGCKRTSLRGMPVFVFSGQGSQWAGMGRKLSREPVFGEMLRRIDGLFMSHGGFSLIDELKRSEKDSRLAETEVAQPTIFALQVALTELWRSWGVVPIAVVGHSVGEIAAAYVAGILTLEAAVELVYHRSRLMQRQTALDGRMVQIERPAIEVESLLADHPELALAASNSPRATVVAGDVEAMSPLLESLDAQEIGYRRLRVSYAFHSAHMEPILDELRTSLASLETRSPKMPLISSVTGRPLTVEPDAEVVMGAEYWCRNVRQTVRFADAIDHLAAAGHDVFVEIAPHPVLATSIDECFADRSGRCEVVPSMRRRVDARKTLLEAVARLHVLGLPVEWKALFPGGGSVVELPLYPWQRERYWLADSVTSDRRGGAVDHPLLGEASELSLGEPHFLWQRYFSLDQPTYLNDHRVRGLTLLPGAALLEMALFAAERHLPGEGPLAIQSASFENALVLSPEEALHLQSLFACVSETQLSFKISSRRDQEEQKDWTLHAKGEVRRLRKTPASAPLDLQQVQARCDEHRTGEEHYREMVKRGLEYGTTFQVVKELWCGERQALALLALPREERVSGEYLAHPTLLDGALQALEAALPKSLVGITYLPVGVEEWTLLQPPAEGEIWVCARLEEGGDPTSSRLRGELQLLDSKYRPWLQARGVLLERVGSAASDGHSQRLWQLEWHQSPVSQDASSLFAADAWLIFEDERGVGSDLAARLKASGARVVRVQHGHGFELVGDDLFTLHPARAEDFQQLLTTAFPERASCGVVHLFGLDALVEPEDSVEELAAAEELALVSALHLAQALVAEPSPIETIGLWWVTAGAQTVAEEPCGSPVGSGLWGLARTVGLEHPRLEGCRIDLGAGVGAEGAECLLRELKIAALAAENGALREDEVAWRRGERWVARLARVHAADLVSQKPLAPAEDRSFRLGTPQPGRLENLTFQAVERMPPGPGQVEIEVRSAGLNFRDVMKALDIYPGLPEGPVPLGDECAGLITAIGEGVEGLKVGDEVVGLADFCFASHVIANAELVLPKPPNLSFDSAAAQLLTFLTAHYAFERIARLEAGEKVLIHAAAGGVGMAAVRLAQLRGAEIFATAGSPEKRELLREIGVEQVMDSRSLDFAEEILRLTEGAGVDVVLNSLSGDFIPASLSVLGAYGRFLEIGKRDIYSNRPLGLEPFKNNLSYSGIDLERVMRQRPQVVRQLLHEVLTWLARGELQPLPHRVFAAEEVVDAFHFMAQARHVGKVILSLADRAAVEIALAADRICRADGTYLITGGFGELGLAVSERLVEQGARHLALVGRRGVPESAREVLARLRQHGATVRELRADLAAASDVARLARELDDAPPLAGIVHAAGLLDDGMLEQLDGERFARVLAPKIHGAWNLQRQFGELPLDVFILFSSITGLLGSPGQASYAAANAAMDGLAAWRRARGQVAQSLAWGPWAEIGMAARAEVRGARMADRGLGALQPEDALSDLVKIAHGPAQLAVVELDTARWLKSNPSAGRGSLLADFRSGEAPPESATDSILNRLRELDPNQRAAALTSYLRRAVAEVLRLEPSRIGLKAPLRTLGLDSLMTVELRNCLEEDLGLTLSSTLAWNYPTIALMVPHLADRLGLALDGSTAGDGEGVAGSEPERVIENKVENLSAAEAEQQLLAELDALAL